MSYLALGASLVLAGFLVASTAAALLSRLVWTLAWRRVINRPPHARAAHFLRLRALPTSAGLGAALLVVAPGFVAFEPAQNAEPVTVSLAGLALAGAVLLLTGFTRACIELGRTRSAVRAWLSGASPLDVALAGVPAFRIRSAMPVVVLAGWLRPRVLVSARVLDCCAGPELDAMIAHETAHLRARDNLKRLLLAACADLLCWTRWSRRLEERWFDATEEAADDRAVRAGSDPAELAGALLKVARLAAGADRRLAASAICRDERVARRIRRLLSLPGPGPQAAPSPRRTVIAATALAAVALLVGTSVTLPYVHHLIELAVAALP